jgi:hypothetical protein
VADQGKIADKTKEFCPDIIKTGGFSKVLFGYAEAKLKNTGRDSAEGGVK